MESIVKKVAILFLLIVTINAQQNDILKSKYGFREFDDPPFENIKTEKSVTKLPALLKSSMANSNPEFVSALSDSAYEDSTYLFNVLTNDPDANSVSVSVTSNPSWLSLTTKTGGGISNITKAYGGLSPDNNVKATESLNGLITDVAVDSDGNFYYSDQSYNVINKIDADGNLTIFAGTGEAGYSGDGGAATSAKLYTPTGLAFDTNGNLYIADFRNHVIRKIDSNGNISTFAGTGTEGLTGDGGAATSATLNNPYDIVFDSNGNLYIADQDNSRIRKVDTSGNISTFAGSAKGYAGDGGAATSAELDTPSGVAFDSNGNLYISDWNAHVVRKVDTNGNISTFAGTDASGYSGDGGAATSAKLSYPWGIEVDPSGNVYIGDYGNYLIRKVDTNGNISTFAGTGTSGYSGDGGAATSATFKNPENTLWYNNNLYIPDLKALRKIDSSGNISTIAGGDGKVYNGDNILASTARINRPRNMWMDKNDNLYFADQTVDRIRKIDANGIITTVAGTGVGGFSGDGGAATSAQINNPRGVTGDNAGNLYISDQINSRIRKVDSNGIISTVAGTGTNGYSGDGGAGTSAQIAFPYALTMYGGDLYFAEINNNVIRKLDVDGDGTISTVAGTGESGYSGDGGLATSALFNGTSGVNFDSQGNMYIADYQDHVIRKVDTNGIITTVAGTGTSGYSGDGGAATSANINGPINVIVDAADNLLIAQWSGNYAIRKVWKGTGIITTIAGNGTAGYTTDKTATDALLTSPQGMALDSKGNLFIGEQGNQIIRKIDASYHTLTGTPTNSEVGTTTMTLTASDGQGGSATQSFALKVINTNDAPVLASVANVTTNEDTAKTVTLSGTDVDGDALTYTGKSNTDKVTISISSATMTLSPAADWYGTASITAYVSDGTVKDSTTFTLSVTPVNDAPIMTFFTPNTSLNFDGTDDYVDLGVISSTNFTNADFSIQTWVKTTSSKAQSILVKGDGDGAWEAGEKALYMETAGYPWFVGYDNEYIPGTGLTINDGLWHHIVVTWDYSEGETGSAAIYVDGVKATVETSYRARTVDNSEDKIYIGKAEAWEAQNDFDGNIDEVGIWDKALSDVEVAALYNASSGLNASINSGNYTSSSNLQGYWRMYEGTGNIINDLSTNNNSGTISGATWDKNTGIGSTNVVTNEETATKIVLSASDIDGDALTYTASADTNAVTLAVLTDSLQLTPALNYTGTSVITVIVSDNVLTDTTKFDFTVINVNDAPVIAAVANDTTSEDSDGKALRLSASDIDGDTLTYTAFSDTLGLTVTVSNDTVRLKPVTDYFGTSKVTAIVNDGAINDSTTFSFTVLNVQDAPYAFDWVSTASDTIDISQSNLTDTYELKWSESKDVDGETIDYLLYVKIGVLEPDEIYDTTSTSIPITYQEFVENVFEPFPMLPRVTVQFTMEATDGIDTVKITGDNRVLFVNRYEYLSTEGEGIPTEFALHENYPNPFNPTTTLRFDFPELSDMTLTIYNMLGQKVKTFSMQSIPAGYHSVTWDATNDLGVQVGAGVYLYQLQTKDFVKTRKMVLLK